MNTDQDGFQQQLSTLLEVVMFENWLRFYFIVSDNEAGQEGDDCEKLSIQLPPKSMERIKELYPQLYPLAEKLNGTEITFATSRDAVLHHILDHIDGKEMARGQAQRILQSQSFQIRLQLFHTWEQMHEDQLDQGFAEFGAWRTLFAQWLDTPGAKELAKRLSSQSKC